MTKICHHLTPELKAARAILQPNKIFARLDKCADASSENSEEVCPQCEGSDTNRQIAMAPGYIYRQISPWISSRKNHDRIFEPSIIMMEEEYIEAYNEGNIKLAKWIQVRYFFVFLLVFTSTLPIIKQILKQVQ